MENNSFNSIIREIKEKIGIQELADKNGVNKWGKSYTCINPEHNDVTPSMKLYIETNTFYCFGCKTGGDIIKFYQLLNNLDFTTALKNLAIYCGLNYDSYTSTDQPPLLEEKAKSIKLNKPIRPAIRHKSKNKFFCEYDQYYFDERSGIVEIDGGLDRDTAETIALTLVKADRLERNKIIFNEFYNYCNKSGLDSKVYNYLVNDRYLSESVIQQKKIFSLNDIPSISKHLINLFDIHELNGSGLFKDGRLFFTNSHRLIIPYLQDDSIIYLRSRYFDAGGNTKTDKGKYKGLLNDSLDLNTVKRFYNDNTLKRMNIYDKIYLTEGELDCLTAETIGFSSIAIPGVSSIPAESEIRKLSDYHVVILMDNDTSGQKAANTFIDIFRELLINYSTITLPEGIKDVNEFLLSELNEIDNFNNNKND